MFRSSGLFWKTGAFVLIGLVVVTATLLTVRNPLRTGYEIGVWVDNGNGLLMGTPVKVAGVPVGEVVSVTLERNEAFPNRPPVLVTVWVPDDVAVFSDDAAGVAMLGILGEKYVEITPGPGLGERLRPGDSLIAQKPVTEAEITQQLTRTLDEFEQALIKVNRIAVDPAPWLALKAEAEASLTKADEMLEQLNETVENVNSVLEQFKSVGEQSGRLFEDIRAWVPWVGLSLASILLLAALI